jgi:hypothetical protein
MARWDSKPAVTVIAGSESVPCTQSGVDKKLTVQQLADANESKSANLASAATTDLSTATAPFVHITGTTTITALGTAQAGTRRVVVFDGVLTLTHNATSLILPTGANIATAAGDVAFMVSEGSGNWRCTCYQRASGEALAGGAGTNGRHMVPIMAGAMAPSTTGGCAALATIASAANQPDIVSLDFDPTTQEYAQFAIPMPESWDEGTITFMPIWSHAATTTNFGVVWELQAVAVSNDDTIAVAYGTSQASTDTGGTTNDLYIGPESAAITVGGTPSAGDVVFFRLTRVTGNGSDTMAVDARLHGIRLYMTTAAATD